MRASSGGISITGVTDYSVDASGYQSVPRLDRDQAAESFAQRKNWPDPQCTTSGEERDTDPANRVTINRPQLPAIRVCRQIRVEKSDYRKHGDDLPVAAGLTHAHAKISAGERGNNGQRQQNHYERDERWVREERSKTTPT